MNPDLNPQWSCLVFGLFSLLFGHSQKELHNHLLQDNWWINFLHQVHYWISSLKNLLHSTSLRGEPHSLSFMLTCLVDVSLLHMNFEVSEGWNNHFSMPCRIAYHTSSSSSISHFIIIISLLHITGISTVTLVNKPETIPHKIIWFLIGLARLLVSICLLSISIPLLRN